MMLTFQFWLGLDTFLLMDSMDWISVVAAALCQSGWLMMDVISVNENEHLPGIHILIFKKKNIYVYVGKISI